MSINAVQRWGGQPGLCPQCNLKVFAAEEVMANGHKWHRLCLKCSSCNKLLSSGNLNNHEDSVYCKPCYAKLFGPKGYGFAGGAAGLPVDVTQESIAPLRQSASVNSQRGGGDAVKKAVGQYSNDSSKPKSGYGSAPTCRRCDKTVFAAERVIGGGHSYHKACFKCSACNRQLDSVTLCERDEELFCRACYGKNFGPKGFGFGITMPTN